MTALPAPKADFKKSSRYRARTGRVDVIEVPPMQYLMIDGHGDPNTSHAYADALASIYPVAYKLKFASKQAGRDYVVPPLEALWWADDMSSFTSQRDKAAWDWTAMLMVPEWITPDMFDAALTEVATRGSPNSLDAVRLAWLNEGMSVQTLHVGPYDAEAGTLA